MPLLDDRRQSGILESQIKKGSFKTLLLTGSTTAEHSSVPLTRDGKMQDPNLDNVWVVPSNRNISFTAYVKGYNTSDLDRLEDVYHQVSMRIEGVVHREDTTTSLRLLAIMKTVIERSDPTLDVNVLVNLEYGLVDIEVTGNQFPMRWNAVIEYLEDVDANGNIAIQRAATLHNFLIDNQNLNIDNDGFTEPGYEPAVKINGFFPAPIDSPHLRGEPTAPTPPFNDNSTNIATTEFVSRFLDETYNTGVAGDTYTKVTVNELGLVTNGTWIDFDDVTHALNYIPFDQNGGTVYGDTVFAANVTILGSTTEIKTMQTIFNDPILTLASNTLVDYDPRDRGIEFKIGNGTAVETGFFGWKSGLESYVFLEPSINNKEVETGRIANIIANVHGQFKLDAPVGLNLIGDVYGNGIIDLTSNVAVSTLLSNSGVVPDTYTKVTVDSKGRVIVGNNINRRDVIRALGYTPYDINGGTIYGDTIITGDLYVRGNTTQINTVQTTIYDPIITLGANSTIVNDGMDRGVEFLIGNGSNVVSGFMGWKNAMNAFVFYEPSINNAEVETGTLADLYANFHGKLTLSSNINISIAGDANASTDTDLGSNVVLNMTLGNSGVVPGRYSKVRVNSKGLVTNGGYINFNDVVQALGYTPYDSNGGLINGNATVAGNVVTNQQFLTIANGSTTAFDRGILFNTGYTPDDLGFFGFNASTDTFNFLNNAVVSNGNVTGNTGTIHANLRGHIQIDPLNVAIKGDASGSDVFDGSRDINIALTLANSGVIANTYTKVTVNAKGLVTNATSLDHDDVVHALGYTPFDVNGGTVYGDTIFNGNVTVRGNTTMIVSTQTTLTDPIITLAKDSGIQNDGFDRGVEFKVGNGTNVVAGFFGWKNAENAYVFYEPTINNAEVETGTLATVKGNFRGHIQFDPLNVTISGDATANTTFDGTSDILLPLTLSNSGVVSGTYSKVTVDAKGRVIGGNVINFDDVVHGLSYIPYDSNGGTVHGRVITDDPFLYLSNQANANTDEGILFHTGYSPTDLGFFGFNTSNNAFVFLNNAIVMNGFVTGSVGTIHADLVGHVKFDPLNVTITGDGTANTTFDGTNDIALNLTLANTGVVPGFHTKVSVNSKGLIDSATSANFDDIVFSLGYIPYDSNGGLIDGDATVNGLFTASSYAAFQDTVFVSGPFITENPFAYISNGSSISQFGPRDGGIFIDTGADTDSFYGYNAALDGFVFLNNATVSNSNVLGDNATIYADVVGNLRLATAIPITVTGDVTGTDNLDGTRAINLPLNLVNTGVTANTYTKVTVDSKGRVMSGALINFDDITHGLEYIPFDSNGGLIDGDVIVSGHFSTDDYVITLTGPMIGYSLGAAAVPSYPDMGVQFYVAQPNSSVKQQGFFGYSPAANGFIFLFPSTTDANGVHSGTQADIIGNFVGNFTGNFHSTTLATFSLQGDATGNAQFDGANNVAITTTLTNSGVVPGIYSLVTVNEKGLATNASNIGPVEITNALGYVPLSSNGTIRQANHWTSSITISFDGDVSGAVTFNGSTDSNTTLSLTANVVSPYANVANSLRFARTITLSDDVYGATTFDGSKDEVINVALTATGVTANTYTKVSVDSKGRVYNGNWINSTDVTDALGYTPLDAADIPNATVRYAHSAGQLANVTYLNVYGDAQGTSGPLNGLGNTSVTVVLTNSGVVAGTYTKVSVDSKGRVYRGNTINSLDVTTALGYVPAPLSSVNSVDSADHWTNTMTLVANGDINGSVTFDGNNTPVYLSTSLTNTGVSAGRYSVVSVDAKGRVTGGGNILFTDVTNALGYTPLSANANVVTAGTYTKVTVNAQGQTIIGSQISNNDVVTALGYTPARLNNNSVEAADHWTNAMTLSFQGDGIMSTTFDGNADTIATFRLVNTGVVAGTYTKVTVDRQGRVTLGNTISSTDITTALGYTPVNVTRVATSSTTGLVKIGSGLSVDSNGLVTLTTASSNQIGGIKLGTGLAVDANGVVSVVGDMVQGDVVFTGNVTIQGNTSILGSPTIISSTQLTLSDPIITLAKDSTFLADGLDRGIEFKYGDGSSVRSGFFGYSTSTNQFKFLTAATQINTVESGTTGTINANLVGSVTGTASYANALKTPRTIYLAGDATGSASFDGSSNATISVNITNSGVTAGIYGNASLVPQITVASDGRITSIATVDITYPSLVSSVNGRIGDVTLYSNDIIDATSSSEASTLVLRDSAGNFNAATIRAVSFIGSLTGTASNATVLKTSRTISLSGDATGSASFDGSTNASISVTFSNTGVTAGSYGNSSLIPTFTVDAKGRISNVQTVQISYPALVSSVNGRAGAITLYSNDITDATSSNTPNTVVLRDANGNFNASTIRATFIGNLTGTASNATALQTARTVSLSGDATGSVAFDGSQAVSISTTLANTSVAAGSYGNAISIPSITVDSKGRLTSVSNTTVQIPNGVTITNATLINPTITNYTETYYSGGSGSSYTVNLANGTIHNFSITATATITIPTVTGNAGKAFTVLTTYTGAYGLSWAVATSGSIKWPSGSTPTPTSVSGKYDLWTFVCDGTYWYGLLAGSNY